MAAGSGCQEGSGRIVVRETEFAGPAGSLAPRLALAGERALLSWLEPAGGGRHAVQVALREPGGAWQPPRTVVVGESLFVNWADVPSVLPLSDGVWLAHWLQKVAAGPYAYHVMMAVSTDGGMSWGPAFRPHEDTSETEHGFVSLVPWNGGAAGVWLDGRGTVGNGPMMLRFTTVSPSGAAARDVEVDARVCECCQTALARTARGLVAAYRDRSDGEVRDVAVRRYEAGRWSEAATVGHDQWHHTGCPVNGPAVAARGNTVALAWFTAAGDLPRVYVALSTDGGTTWGTARRVDDGRPAGRVDVVWWGRTALVSWIEETADAGDVRVRELRADGTVTGSTVVAVTRASRAAGFPRLAAVGDTALVAWTVPGEGGGVRVAALTRVP
jgi:hypothetical protein